MGARQRQFRELAIIAVIGGAQLGWHLPGWIEKFSGKPAEPTLRERLDAFHQEVYGASSVHVQTGDGITEVRYTVEPRYNSRQKPPVTGQASPERSVYVATR